MTHTTTESTIWWHPAEDNARRLWADALQRAGLDRSRPVAALVAACARVRLDDQGFADIVGLPRSWLLHPTPTTRRRGSLPMIREERQADLQRFIDDLTALTHRYGFELTADPTPGLSIRDLEHQAVLACNGELDDEERGYRFERVGVTAPPYLPGDEGT